MTLSVFTYDNNKINYLHTCINLSEDEIISNMLDSRTFVFIDDHEFPKDFVNKKYLRFFTGEKYNLDKVCYILWNLKYNGYIIDFDSICKKLPENIKYIKLSNNYNNELNHLPCSITHIVFGAFFNSLIDNLPFSIEYLLLGQEFNQPIDNLPGGLKKLLFVPNSKFNKSLDNLPNFLQYLFLPIKYSNPLDNLPNFLIHIDISCSYKFELNNLPNSLEKIIFYPNDNRKYDEYTVPKNTIYYYPLTNYEKIYNIDNIFVKFPQKLKYLDLTYSYILNFLSEYVEYELVSNNNINSNVKKDIIKKTQPLDNLPR